MSSPLVKKFQALAVGHTTLLRAKRTSVRDGDVAARSFLSYANISGHRVDIPLICTDWNTSRDSYPLDRSHFSLKPKGAAPKALSWKLVM